MSSFLGAVLVFGRDVTLVLFAILSFLSFREFMSLTPTRRRRPSLAVLIVLCPRASEILADRDRLVRALVDFHPGLRLSDVAGIVGGGGIYQRFPRPQRQAPVGLTLTVFAISHAPAPLLLDLSGYRLPNALLLLYLMIVVQISDVFRYVFGKFFGRTKMSPAISPSRTVEDLLGGGLTAVLIGAALSGITPFSPLQAAAMSAVIVIGGFFGGFVLSAVNRDLCVLDWCRMIEGHAESSTTWNRCRSPRRCSSI